jgi:ABC-type transport system involved in cytochrome bd biosynthesis fused ATPase/permease subunit
MRSRLMQHYTKIYISMDITETDKYGTGKFSSLISEGVYQVVNMYLRYGASAVVGALGIVYAIVLIALKSPTLYHFIGIIGIVAVSFFFFWKGIMQMQYARKETKEISLSISRQLTKIIMSKMEIIQNNKIDTENNILNDFHTRTKFIRMHATTKKHAFQTVANLLFDGCRIFLFL